METEPSATLMATGSSALVMPLRRQDIHDDGQLSIYSLRPELRGGRGVPRPGIARRRTGACFPGHSVVEAVARTAWHDLGLGGISPFPCVQ